MRELNSVRDQKLRDACHVQWNFIEDVRKHCGTVFFSCGCPVRRLD